MKTRLLIAATATTALIAGSASAATSAFATTDLNLRAGPGPQYDIVGVIDGNAEASVEGCIADSNWCQVSYNGQTGWAFGEYLAHSLETPVPVYSPESTVTVDTVTYESSESDAGATTGALAGGAAAAAAVGGPLAIVGGMMVGGLVGSAADVKETTVTYIRENPVDPIYADGEVVVGAKLSDTSVIQTIPDSEYGYVLVNNTTAVVDPASGEIVYIVR